MNENFNLLIWLNYFYGSLFQPQATFEQLRAKPAPLSAAIVVILANVLEGLRWGQSLPMVLVGLVAGLLGWILLISILDRLSQVFSKSPEFNIVRLLTLTGFASSPWIFMPSAQAIEAPWRLPVVLMVGIWFGIWQVWSTAIALGVSPWRLLSLIPLAMIGGSVGLVLLANLFRLFLSI